MSQNDTEIGLKLRVHFTKTVRKLHQNRTKSSNYRGKRTKERKTQSAIFIHQLNLPWSSLPTEVHFWSPNSDFSAAVAVASTGTPAALLFATYFISAMRLRMRGIPLNGWLKNSFQVKKIKCLGKRSNSLTVWTQERVQWGVLLCI